MKIILFVAIIYIVCKGISALSRVAKERARQREIAKVKAEQARRSAEAARLSEEFRAQQQAAREAAKRQAQIEREQIRQQVEVERERIRQEKEENTPLNKQIIECNTRYEMDNCSVDSGPVDRESLTSTYKIGLTITMTSSADHKKTDIASVRRQLTTDESKFLKDAAKELEKRVNELKPFDQIDLSPPSENDEIVYLPIEGTFNRKFFTRLYLLRYHSIANVIISPFDMVQYQIPVKATNVELILLVYGDHLFESIQMPMNELAEPIGKSLCDNTDEIIKKSCPVVSIPFSVWDYRDGDPSRQTAVLGSEEFKRHGEQAWRIREWIKENFRKASAEYSRSKWNIVKWVQEYKLFNLVRFWYDDAVFQYAPSWLCGQSLDMFIPAINTGIEYQGKQHYEAVDYFGGDEKLAENAIRDKTKSDLCKQNHVILHYWPYTKKVTFSAVREYLGKKPSDVNVQLSQFTPVPVTNVLLKADTHTKKEKRERQKEKTEKHLQTVIRAYDKNGIFVGEYTTLAAASEEVGVSMASVQKCLSGQRKFAGNLMWHREDWGTDPLGINDLFGALEEGIDGAKSTDDTATSQKTPGVRKSVIQIDPATGEIVSVFESISAAARAVGISSKGIQDVLKKKQKTAGGFYWQSDDIAE